jgi:hypothetical protein
MAIDELLGKFLNVEIVKNNSIPWYLVSCFLKLNPGTSIYQKTPEGDVVLKEFKYNINTDEIEYIFWNQGAQLQKGSMKHFPITINYGEYVLEKPKSN